jgi:hypothetical protein
LEIGFGEGKNGHRETSKKVEGLRDIEEAGHEILIMS